MINAFNLYTEKDIKTMKLKSLYHFHQNLKKFKARLKIQLTSYVDIIFPELQFFFKSVLHIKSCYELLKIYSPPDNIAALHLTKLNNILSKASRGQFGKLDTESRIILGEIGDIKRFSHPSKLLAYAGLDPGDC